MNSETGDMKAGNHGDVVLEAKKSKLKPPPMFKVILLNDDFTPMDFVVAVLQTFFQRVENRQPKSCSKYIWMEREYVEFIPTM